MRKVSSFIIPVILAALLVVFSSCMHMAMMGGHDMDGEQMAATVTKEVVDGENSLSVSISPMTVGKEGAITIAYRSKASVSESLFVHYMILEDASAGITVKHNHAGHLEAPGDFEAVHQSALLRNGTRTIAYVPTVPGNFVLKAESENLQNAVSPFSIEVAFVVRGKESHGIMGMGSMWDYPIIGVLAMGGLMLTMWAIRGGF
jgi:hypothetical protein